SRIVSGYTPDFFGAPAQDSFCNRHKNGYYSKFGGHSGAIDFGALSFSGQQRVVRVVAQDATNTRDVIIYVVLLQTGFAPKPEFQ
ncbi:MAG: hypothetical protein KAR36_13240, partial [Candidatus Latescibacteria bacterium]|nr:hypothetical protein [Candidatus Latescibacterota bacterium]